ncbi:FAD-dependent oxidoreductase [Herminiimonas contaminans]|uniref:FAD-dependent oxidoreductase n=1 Tax=Herminiimonas contaminans TaxID=1111140 RepID=A0ABS0EYK1_9BURK|nr:FAD-dependent oxidoreductase [Herminiimonas contaminans]MBF8179264.1 FAD-dependent oxidoreductase [Herminiimonas contaminans]
MSARLVEAAWRQYICRACGLIYDEKEGDPDSGLQAGTRYEDIPDDWSCPLCGVTKADFELYIAVSIPPTIGVKLPSASGTRGQAGIVIVGAGCAGWQMASALRDLDSQVPITIVTGCSGDVYDKPLLSVAIAKKLPLERLVKETASEAAERLNVRLLIQTHAVSVSANASALRTTRGTLSYQNLVLAHGATQRQLPELPEELCWRINDLQAYGAFRKRIEAQAKKESQQIAIVGAGLVGCELANDLALAGHNVCLLDINARPLQGVISDLESADLLHAWENLPLQYVGSVQISSVHLVDGKRRIQTHDGQIFDVDHVISATGLTTPSQLARTAGLTWNNGIAVDPLTLRTNISNIHALGDCISIDGDAYRFIEPINRQARIIAAHLTGNKADAYLSRRPVVRVKTSSRSFTI